MSNPIGRRPRVFKPKLIIHIFLISPFYVILSDLSADLSGVAQAKSEALAKAEAKNLETF
jgi:hypothetical protein